MLTYERLVELANIAANDARDVLLTREQISEARTVVFEAMMAQPTPVVQWPGAAVDPRVVMCDTVEESDPYKLGWVT